MGHISFSICSRVIQSFIERFSGSTHSRFQCTQKLQAFTLPRSFAAPVLFKPGRTEDEVCLLARVEISCDDTTHSHYVGVDSDDMSRGRRWLWPLCLLCLLFSFHWLNPIHQDARINAVRRERKTKRRLFFMRQNFPCFWIEEAYAEDSCPVSDAATNTEGHWL